MSIWTYLVFPSDAVADVAVCSSHMLVSAAT